MSALSLVGIIIEIRKENLRDDITDLEIDLLDLGEIATMNIC